MGGDVDPAQDDRREMSFLEFLAGYLLTLGVMVAGALLADSYFNWGPYRGVVLSVGVLYLLAAAVYPGWLFQIVRRVRWFGAIESDELMRFILVLLGGLLLAAVVLWGSVGRLLVRQ